MKLPPTKRDELAQKVSNQCEHLTVSLSDLEDDIRALWAQFELLESGERILGCKNKKQFCANHLRRSPRAVQYLLKNHEDEGEKTSPLSDDIEEVKKPPRCGVTPLNITDTRCLSMALERLEFAQEKAQMLVDAMQSAEFADQSSDIAKVLKIYIKMFQGLQTLCANGIQFLLESLERK